MSKPTDYFDNEHYAELVERYQAVKLAHDVLAARKDIATSSAKLRRFRRVNSGGSERDKKLERIEAELAPIAAEYRQLREALSVGIYDVARNFARVYAPFRKRRDDVEDFIQEAVLYGLKAVCRFDVARATSLLSFLTAACRFTWLPMLRRERQQAEKLQGFVEEQTLGTHYHGRRRRPNRIQHNGIVYDGNNNWGEGYGPDAD